MHISGPSNSSLRPLTPSGTPKAEVEAFDVIERVSLGECRDLGLQRPDFPAKSPTRVTLSPDLGQVQIALNGRDLFSHSSDLGFLGPEAAKSIGDGARWRHPFPQDWPWPPVEPRDLQAVTQNGTTRLEIVDPDFLRHYGAQTALTVRSGPGGSTLLQADLTNLDSKPKSAWIVAPFNMPSGHSLEEPEAVAVFPILDKSELEQLQLSEGDPAAQTWDYDARHQLMFVAPGASLGEHQQKAYFSDRPSLFGRKGDSSVMFMKATGAEGPQGFQVFAAIHNYVELEWAGKAVAQDEKSQVGVELVAIDLSSLKLEIEGHKLEKLGQSSLGLKAELLAVSRALIGCEKAQETSKQ